MTLQRTVYRPPGRMRAATLVAPLLLICVASWGYFSHDTALRIALAVVCVLLAVASGAILAAVYRPRATSWTAPNLHSDLAALDALEPLRGERPEDLR